MSNSAPKSKGAKKTKSLESSPGMTSLIENAIENHGKITTENHRKITFDRDIPNQEQLMNKNKSSKNKSNYDDNLDIFSVTNKSKIEKFLTSEQKYEIEASIGTFDNYDKFYPGVKSLFHLNLLRWNFKNNINLKEDSFTETVSNYEVNIIQNDEENIRRIKKGDKYLYQKKIRSHNDNINQKYWGIRVSKSYEENLEKKNFQKQEWGKILKKIEEWEKKWKEVEDLIKKSNKHFSQKKGVKSKIISVKRLCERRSFVQKNKSACFYGLKFDLTTVRESRIRENGIIENLDKYEVEIERNEVDVKYETFVKAIKWVFEKLQHVMKGQGQLMDLEEKRMVIRLHNKLFGVERYGDPYRLYSRYWNKPVNIKLNNMISPKFNPYVTIKMDGKRYSLLFCFNGIYMISPPYDIFKVGLCDEHLNGTLVDCEFLQVYDKKTKKYTISKIYGFDIIFNKGLDVRFKSFTERYEFLNSIGDVGVFDNNQLFNNIEYEVKKYYFYGNFYEKTREAFIDINKFYNRKIVDGLIFQPGDYYKNNHTFKWKSENDMSIDFLLEPMSIQDIINNIDREHTHHHKKAFWLIVGDGKIFEGTNSNPHKGFIITKSSEFEGETLAYKIVECKWKKIQGEKNYYDFKPYRIRDDRDKPNAMKTAIDVWNDILNPISKDTIQGNTLQLMRKYHNIVKKDMLSNFFSKGSTILDIGSGRGGDLLKWINAGINTVYVTEPNLDNLKELKKRMKELKNTNKTSIYTINKGAEDTVAIWNKLSEHGHILDGIVSFFSLTFFPESKELYDNLLETIDLIPEGGKIIGIVMDGMSVRKLLEDHRKKMNEIAKKEGSSPIRDDEAIEFETKAYDIVQISEFGNDMFENEIKIDVKESTSMVKNQTEWLFYFEQFRKDLESKGFELITESFLDNGDIFNMLPESSKIFSKMNKTFVFQKHLKKKYIQTPKTFKIDDNLPKKFISKYGDNLDYLKIEPGPLNFIQAVLTAYLESYNNMDKEIKHKYAVDTRNLISHKLSEDIFKKLNSGELSEILQHSYIDEYTKEDALKIAYLEFKLKVADSNVWLGGSSLLEITSKVLKIDIYILLLNRPKVKNNILIETSKKECKASYTNKKSILLYTPDNTNYYVIYRKSKESMQTVFDSDSIIIQNIKKDICQ